MTVITVQVTQRDIDNGIPNNTCNCAVALALNRHIPIYQIWQVGTNDAAPLFSSDIHIDIDDEVERFILGFDLKLDVKPFSFDAEIKHGWEEE